MKRIGLELRRKPAVLVFERCGIIVGPCLGAERKTQYPDHHEYEPFGDTQDLLCAHDSALPLVGPTSHEYSRACESTDLCHGHRKPVFQTLQGALAVTHSAVQHRFAPGHIRL